MYFNFFIHTRFIAGILFLVLGFNTSTFASETSQILVEKGHLILTESHIEIYYQYVTFLIEENLTESEKESIKKETITSFKESPEQISYEVKSLENVLDYLSEMPEERKNAIREEALQTIFSYQKDGHENAFTQVITSHKMNPPD